MWISQTLRETHLPPSQDEPTKLSEGSLEGGASRDVDEVEGDPGEVDNGIFGL